MTENEGVSESSGRFAMLAVKWWDEARAMHLPWPKPNPVVLLLYLLSGPVTSMLPGLTQSTLSNLAESLGWRREGLNTALKELTDRGLVWHDAAAKIFFVPAALDLGRKMSPNAIAAWRRTWESLPRCPLLDRIESAFRARFGQSVDPVFGKEPRIAESKKEDRSCQKRERESEDEHKGSPAAERPDSPSSSSSIKGSSSQDRQVGESQRPDCFSGVTSIEEERLTYKETEGSPEWLVEVWNALRPPGLPAVPRLTANDRSLIKDQAKETATIEGRGVVTCAAVWSESGEAPEEVPVVLGPARRRASVVDAGGVEELGERAGRELRRAPVKGRSHGERGPSC